MVRFDKYFVTFEAIKVKGQSAVKVDVDVIRQDAGSWIELEQVAETNEHTEALKGKIFTGLVEDVVTFGHYGVRVTMPKVKYVKKPM